MFQIPVAGSYVPTEAVADTFVVPAGTGSLTTMARASLGPRLDTVIVYTTFWPTTGVVVSAVLVRAMSAATGMVSVAGADRAVCPIGVVPVAVAVLVRVPSGETSCSWSV